MKKFITLICTLVMVISVGMPVNAQSKGYYESVNLSEYEIASKYKDKSYEDLIALGLNEKEAAEVVDFNKTILENVIELSKFSNYELEKLGYSKTQISSLKSISKNVSIKLSESVNDTELTIDESFVISDSDLISLLSANLTLNVNVVPKSTTFSVSYSFQWSSKPFILRRDGIGFSWDQGFTCPSSNVSSIISYVGGNHNGTKTNKYVYPAPGTGVVIEFDMTNTDGQPPSATVPSWAKSGIGGFELVNQNNSDRIHIAWAYGHTTLTFTPSISIDGTPGISIRFGTSREDYGDGIYRIIR